MVTNERDRAVAGVSGGLSDGENGAPSDAGEGGAAVDVKLIQFSNAYPSIEFEKIQSRARSSIGSS